MTVLAERKSEKERPAKLPGVLPIYSVTPFTMLDFPDHTACIIWFTGCNMRCPYCHNPQIVKGKGRDDIEQVMTFLEKRRGLLDGVVLSGGEASVYSGLPDFIHTLKKMCFAVKLDTNGLRPDLIRSFLNDRLIDYVALDYKSPPEKFKIVSGTDKFSAFSETVNFLCDQKKIPFEIRTTVHTDLMDENDINWIMADLEARKFKGRYAVQNFTHSDDRPTLGFMPAQHHQLDLSQIRKPDGFQVEFRNFQ